MNKISIGDRVRYRGGFGIDPQTEATVIGMDLTEEPREKYGQPVETVPVETVLANRVLFSLDDSHWAYSEQIDAVQAGGRWHSITTLAIDVVLGLAPDHHARNG